MTGYTGTGDNDVGSFPVDLTTRDDVPFWLRADAPVISQLEQSDTVQHVIGNTTVGVVSGAIICIAAGFAWPVVLLGAIGFGVALGAYSLAADEVYGGGAFYNQSTQQMLNQMHELLVWLEENVLPIFKYILFATIALAIVYILGQLFEININL